jgi:hypothetical protein
VVQDVVDEGHIDVGGRQFGSVNSPATVTTFATPASFARCWMYGKKLRSISTA